ncbi:MAG TPA: amidohydrolase family protein [Gemmatimonadaceae bacterium]|nr:amidohydrolase family protein [Gemmatimonadaceae bacterium]
MLLSRLLGTLLLLVFASCTRNQGRSVAAQPSTLAFAHVTLIDGRSETPRRDMTVVVRGNRIAAVGPADSMSVAGIASVIDGRGKYLIPGLWDMHVHTVMPGGRQVLALYVANGVTGVRDMAGDWPTLMAWRRAIANGTLVGPRIVTSGPYLEGGDVPIPHLTVKTPADAQPAVDSLIRLGVDFIKVHSQLTRESYFAIARAARARGVPFVGHVPRSVGAADASDSGQRSIEHLLTIPNECSPQDSVALEPRFTVQSALGRCTSADQKPLFAKLVSNNTWVVPTLVAQLEVALWPTRALPGDSFARYLPDSLKRFVGEIFPMPPDVPPNADQVGRRLFAKRIAITGALHRAGVHIMPGTDAPLRNSPPGFGLHQELAYFIQGGLTPFEALRAATLEPARFFGMLDSLGTVETGRLADLVLLDANPLEDITNARRTSAVLANGRLFDVRRDARGQFVRLDPYR